MVNKTLEGTECLNSGTIYITLSKTHGMTGESAVLVNGVSGKIYICGGLSHAIWGRAESVMENNGFIDTNRPSSCGMLAETASSAFNTGSVKTAGSSAVGLRAEGNSSSSNHGSITTWGSLGYGMEAEDSSSAENSGVITTNNLGAHGILASYNSRGTNRESGIIHTRGGASAGMSARYDSLIENFGMIKTEGKDSPGIRVWNDSTAENGGTIETFGRRSPGVLAIESPSVISSGTITTTAEESPGMDARQSGQVVNRGTVTTEGASARGMYGWKSTFLSNDSGAFIKTSGAGSAGMHAETGSRAENIGKVATEGTDSPGISVLDQSETVNSGTIVTEGTGSPGILAEESSIAQNRGTIVTTGFEASGMTARGGSRVLNAGVMTVLGERAYGMTLSRGSTGSNTGRIQIQGEGACGILVLEGSSGKNSGEIFVSGHQGDGVRVDAGRFTNSGTLASIGGNAVTAQNGAIVELRDGTVLPHSRVLAGDPTSTLLVDMGENIAMEVQGFGNFTKSGAGTMEIEGHSSFGDTLVSHGSLKIGRKGRFVTDTYTQTGDAALYLYAVPCTDANSDQIPLWVEDEANLAGKITIDVSPLFAPGFFESIRTSGVSGGFDKVSYSGGRSHLDFYRPQWKEGGSLHYTGMAGYSFSEQALGIAAAIDGWSFFRRATSDRFNDFFMQAKETSEVSGVSYYGDFVTGETCRDPSGDGTAGYDSTTSGLFFGTQNQIDDDTIQWGLFAGYTEQEINFTGLPGVAADWEKQDTWHVGGYVSRLWGDWIISDTLAWHSTSHESFRRQTGDDARGDFSSWSVTNDIRAMYLPQSDKANQGWQIIPEVGLNAGYFNRDGYSEVNGFTYGDFSTTVVESLLGVRVSKDFVTKEGNNLNTQLQLAWTHNLSGSDISIDRSWNGDTKWYKENLRGDNLISAELMLSFYNKNNSVFSLSCRGRFSEDSRSWGGKISLEWTL